MNILITNDDGIHFRGLIDLRAELDKIGKTFVFAPSTEKSATSMALTIYDDIYVHRIDERTFMVEGYPADCVNVGLYGALIAEPIDLVVSGINKGVNMGQDVLYSGTVGAARHGFVHGIAALAVSCGHTDARCDYTPVAVVVRKFIEAHLELIMRPSLLNINIPVDGPPKGIKWTKLGQRIYRDSYRKSHLNDGGLLLNLGGSILSHKEDEGADFSAYDAGYVSVTPLTLDATDHPELSRISTCYDFA